MDDRLKAVLPALLLLALANFSSFAQETSSQRMKPVLFQHVQIEDEFWSPKLKVWREVTIPALGIEVQLQFDWSGGILEWRIE